MLTVKDAMLCPLYLVIKELPVYEDSSFVQS